MARTLTERQQRFLDVLFDDAGLSKLTINDMAAFSGVSVLTSFWYALYSLFCNHFLEYLLVCLLNNYPLVVTQ